MLTYLRVLLIRASKIILAVAGALVISVLQSFIIGLLLWPIWNMLMPKFFHLPVMNLLESWGVVVICHVLFKMRVRHTRCQEG